MPPSRRQIQVRVAQRHSKIGQSPARHLKFGAFILRFRAGSSKFSDAFVKITVKPSNACAGSKSRISAGAVAFHAVETGHLGISTMNLIVDAKALTISRGI